MDAALYVSGSTCSLLLRLGSGTLPPCLQEVCTGRGSVAISKAAARGGWHTLQHQGHEEETDWIFFKILNIQEPKFPTVLKRGAVRVSTYQVCKWILL